MLNYDLSRDKGRSFQLAIDHTSHFRVQHFIRRMGITVNWNERRPYLVTGHNFQTDQNILQLVISNLVNSLFQLAIRITLSKHNVLQDCKLLSEKCSGSILGFNNLCHEGRFNKLHFHALMFIQLSFNDNVVI